MTTYDRPINNPGLQPKYKDFGLCCYQGQRKYNCCLVLFGTGVYANRNYLYLMLSTTTSNLVVVKFKQMKREKKRYANGSQPLFKMYCSSRLCDICRLTPPPVGLLPVGLLPIATFAGQRHLPVRDICRSRHLPIATFAD